MRGFLTRRDSGADRVVPPSGTSAWLTVLTAGAMAFLAVFALALSLATGQLSKSWSTALSQGATIRVAAPEGQVEAQTASVLQILEQTPGVASARALGLEETRRLLEPWFGPGLPVESLPVPQLIELREAPGGFDAEGLRLRLRAEAPGATLDDHQRWRRPLVAAAGRVRLLGLFALVLIGAVTAAMVMLAAMAALAANGQVIRVLRLVGARDRYIARAFVRRFTLRAFAGASVGTLAGALILALMPAAAPQGGLLAGIGFNGAGWLWPLCIPLAAGLAAYVATAAAAHRALKAVP